MSASRGRLRMLMNIVTCQMDLRRAFQRVHSLGLYPPFHYKACGFEVVLDIGLLWDVLDGHLQHYCPILRSVASHRQNRHTRIFSDVFTVLRRIPFDLACLSLGWDLRGSSTSAVPREKSRLVSSAPAKPNHPSEPADCPDCRP